MTKKAKKPKKKKTRKIKHRKTVSSPKPVVGGDDQSSTKTEANPIEVEISKFVSAIEGLAQSLPLVMHVVDTANNMNLERLQKFVDEKAEGTSKDGKNTVYQVPFEHLFDLKKHLRNLKGLNLAYQLIPNSFIVSLVSQYDGFLSAFLKLLIKEKPDILNSSEKDFSYSKIIEFDSIDDVKDYIIEKEIESILRKSHCDQLKRISNLFNIKIDPRDQLKKRFVEVTERRNLFVHCNGVISSQYMAMCIKNDIKVESDSTVGSTLSVDPEYFNTAYECMFEIGTTIGQVLWRKLVPDQAPVADQNLVEMVFNLLCYEMYDLAERMSKFGHSGLNKNSSDIYRRIFIINEALARKLNGKKKYLIHIEKEDWTATSNKFKLAVHLLKDNFDEASCLMNKIGPNGELTKHDYTNWPIFKEFRETKQFKQAYEEVFGEGFSLEHDEVIDKAVDSRG